MGKRIKVDRRKLMTEKATHLSFSGIFVKTEHSDAYVPQKPSPKALICLSCDPNKKCKGNCKRFKEEYRKLKEKKDG